jgi:hypothetical protein
MDKYNHWLGKLLAKLNGKKNYCITLGQTSYYSCSKEVVDMDLFWRREEDFHKVQWKRDGIKMLFRYIRYMITLGYAKNPYEIEAKEYAAKSSN